MDHPETKMETARGAAIRAVGALRPGTRFAVVQGTHKAEMVYPGGKELAVADDDTLRRARKRIGDLEAEGGTAIGAWLALARRLFEGLSQAPTAPIRHAVLLTDGRNEHFPELLPRELDACDGLFTCDAWGIGHDWERRELRLIADRLRGSADVVLDEAKLPARFEETVRASMARTIPTLPIRISLTPGTGIAYLKQVFPRELDITGDGRPVDEGARIVEFPTHAWSGEERRQYHLCLRADPAGQPLDQDIRLGMAEVVTPPELGPAPDAVPLQVCWLPGKGPSTERPSRPSDHYSAYEDLVAAVEEGCEAFAGGDPSAAEEAFRRAFEIVRRLGDQHMRSMLEDFMDVDDEAPGEERLREGFDPRLLDRLWIRRSETTPDLDPQEGEERQGEEGERGQTGGPLRACQNPKCQHLSPPDARYCEACGWEPEP
jgi:hypothetical protein